jgi:hypothetical protein
MRMMGGDSVAYDEKNVAGRSDDHAGPALAYYGSREETPLTWGGSGASMLGVDGILLSVAGSARAETPYPAWLRISAGTSVIRRI